ncbi:MAG: indolepyruvate oxidoreductase subunit beta [Chloroflexi bacterium]|nr:indolepyruvate oxidoreductase subunit beta [Chloroflexota bacterium]
MSTPETRGPVNLLLCGVGGQGILLAADVVALVGVELGYDVKKSEIHGMAQRGGSVTSHVRWAQRVYSPLSAPGEVDYVVAFERLEALRYAALLRPGGTLLVNDYRITPGSVTAGQDDYPSAQQEAETYGERVHVLYLPAMALAQQLGQVRVNNIVMLGALSAHLATPEEVWRRVIASRVPARFVELNERAFAAGRAHALGQPARGR